MKTYEQILAEYQDTYELDLSTPNDRANVDMLIRNQQLIQKLQATLAEQTNTEDLLDVVGHIKKLQDALRDLIDQNLAIERALGIDRKNRKKDNQESVADYIQMIKTGARDWLERNLITVYCKDCRVLVGRILPAHEYTEFDCRFQCSQCQKFVRAHRAERDIFFDIKERNKDWRRQYPIEIVQPKDVADTDENALLLEDEDATTEA